MTVAAPWKKNQVAELVTLIKAHPTIGIVTVGNIPGPQMQKMRSRLRKSGEMRVAKLNLIKIALESAGDGKENLASMIEYLDGQAALVATDINPFLLYKQISSTQTKAPARGGETAPDDISVQKGETPFKPGPIVGELGKAGIPAAIEKGKVVIKKSKTLVNKGEKIPREVALMLTKLEIYPLTVGINLLAAYEDGTVFMPDVLNVDHDAFLTNIRLAASNAFGLAVEVGYTTPATIEPIITRSTRDAIAVLLEAGYPARGKMDLLIGRAHSQMLAIALKADGLDEELSNMVSGAATAAVSSAPVSSTEDDAKKGDDEDDEEEEVSEDEAAAGLDSLFG